MVITNAASNNSNVAISAAGSSTDIGINLLPKNDGNVNILSSSTPGGLRFYSSTDPTTTKFTGLTAPSAPYGVTFTLPASDGTNGQALVTDGSGALTFTTISDGAGGNNTEIQYNNGGSLAGLSSFTTDGTDLTLTQQLNFNSTATSNIYADTSELNLGSTEAIIMTHSVGEGIVLTDSVSTANITLFNDSNTIKYNGTDITIASSGDINLTASGDVNIPANVGLTFADDGEKIESDGTNLTISSGADINLTATSNVNVPNDVSVTFGGDTQYIRSADSNELQLGASGNVTISTGNFVMSSEVILAETLGTTRGGATNKQVSKSVTYYYLTGNNNWFTSVSGNPSSNGAIWHVLFDSNGGTGYLEINFGSNGLTSGSGYNQYLTFNNRGESTSMIYISSKWHVINTGATVS